MYQLFRNVGIPPLLSITNIIAGFESPQNVSMRVE